MKKNPCLIFIELDYGKNYSKALYLMVKTMVSCRFSLNPIQWDIDPHHLIGGFHHLEKIESQLGRIIKYMENKTCLKPPTSHLFWVMLHILYDIQYTLFAYLNMIKPILCNKLPEAISHYIPNEHYGFIHNIPSSNLTVRPWVGVGRW